MSWWGKSKDPKPEEKKNEATQIKDAIVEKLPSKEELHEKSQHINQTGKNENVFDDIAEG
jgi:fission process protein 1